jgi:hypothetical protein
MATLSEVRAVQPHWFSRKNKRFFNDVSYKVLHGKVSHRPYLVRATYQWSDMFDQPKTLRYRINTLKDDLSIGPLLNQQFRDLDHVKEWLETELQEAAA